jgi:hypothetical protein
MFSSSLRWVIVLCFVCLPGIAMADKNIAPNPRTATRQALIQINRVLKVQNPNTPRLTPVYVQSAQLRTLAGRTDVTIGLRQGMASNSKLHLFIPAGCTYTVQNVFGKRAKVVSPAHPHDPSLALKAKRVAFPADYVQ